jgi:hypothetical protein
MTALYVAELVPQLGFLRAGMYSHAEEVEETDNYGRKSHSPVPAKASHRRASRSLAEPQNLKMGACDEILLRM